MQLYSTQQLIFAHALQDLQEFFQLSVCSQNGQGRPAQVHNFCTKGLFGYTQEQNLVQNVPEKMILI